MFKRQVNEELSYLIKISTPKLQSASLDFNRLIVVALF